MSWGFWIIRHAWKDAVLPAPTGRRASGGTHVEPVDIGGPWPPRLFHTEAAAKQALTWWLKGRTTVTQSGHVDMWSGAYESDEDWHTEPAPERKREDWTVVPAKLEISKGDHSAV